MPRRIDFDVDGAAEDYLRGMSLADVAEQYGCSYSTVRDRFLKAGVQMRPKGPRYGTVPRPFDRLRRFDRERAAEMRRNGINDSDIAREVGVTPTAVCQALKGVPRVVKPKTQRLRKWRGEV